MTLKFLPVTAQIQNPAYTRKPTEVKGDSCAQKQALEVSSVQVMSFLTHSQTLCSTGRKVRHIIFHCWDSGAETGWSTVMV